MPTNEFVFIVFRKNFMFKRMFNYINKATQYYCLIHFFIYYTSLLTLVFDLYQGFDKFINFLAYGSRFSNSQLPLIMCLAFITVMRPRRPKAQANKSIFLVSGQLVACDGLQRL